MKHFETELPEGYREVFTVDAADQKTGIKLNPIEKNGKEHREACLLNIGTKCSVYNDRCPVRDQAFQKIAPQHEHQTVLYSIIFK